MGMNHQVLNHPFFWESNEPAPDQLIFRGWITEAVKPWCFRFMAWSSAVKNATFGVSLKLGEPRFDIPTFDFWLENMGFGIFFLALFLNWNHQKMVLVMATPDTFAGCPCWVDGNHHLFTRKKYWDIPGKPRKIFPFELRLIDVISQKISPYCWLIIMLEFPLKFQ